VGVERCVVSIPNPSQRPDVQYWKTPWSERKRPPDEELETILEKLEEYSSLRFVVGRRFKLVKEFQGIPVGTCCTVVDVWPSTAVRWDKWSKSGFGSNRKTQDVLFELDMSLEIT
jgi:hypothetical protein